MRVGGNEVGHVGLRAAAAIRWLDHQPVPPDGHDERISNAAGRSPEERGSEPELRQASPPGSPQVL
jgi:hypothetical protein